MTINRARIVTRQGDAHVFIGPQMFHLERHLFGGVSVFCDGLLVGVFRRVRLAAVAVATPQEIDDAEKATGLSVKNGTVRV